MSTRNIYFSGEISKIILKLSSNILIGFTEIVSFPTIIICIYDVISSAVAMQ